jgi:hypothetical protein
MPDHAGQETGLEISGLKVAEISSRKGEAFALRSKATKQSIPAQTAKWIASRSLSSGGASRRSGGSQ